MLADCGEDLRPEPVAQFRLRDPGLSLNLDSPSGCDPLWIEAYYSIPGQEAYRGASPDFPSLPESGF